MRWLEDTCVSHEDRDAEAAKFRKKFAEKLVPGCRHGMSFALFGEYSKLLIFKPAPRDHVVFLIYATIPGSKTTVHFVLRLR